MARDKNSRILEKFSIRVDKNPIYEKILGRKTPRSSKFQDGMKILNVLVKFGPLRSKEKWKFLYEVFESYPIRNKLRCIFDVKISLIILTRKLRGMRVA